MAAQPLDRYLLGNLKLNLTLAMDEWLPSEEETAPTCDMAEEISCVNSPASLLLRIKSVAVEYSVWVLRSVAAVVLTRVGEGGGQGITVVAVPLARLKRVVELLPAVVGEFVLQEVVARYATAVV